jgi:hypothetical protein
MKTFTKSLIVALLQVAIVLSLGGKLLYDRAHRPRIWVKTGSVDPDLPIRGRYLTLNLEVHAPGLNSAATRNKPDFYAWQSIELTAENGELVAHKSDKHTELSLATWGRRPNQSASDVYFLWPSVAFFLPEHAEVPRIKPGEELWAEVTIPRKGPPRPIQLAVKRGTEWNPLTYR